MKKLSTAKQNSIIKLLEDGLSSRKIAPQVGVGRVSVDNIRKKIMPNAKKPPKGRPRKLSAQDKRRLVRQVTSGKADTATQLTRDLCSSTNIEVSAQTVRRALKEAGLKSATKKKSPRLLPRHVKERYEFAQTHQHWTVEDWKRVVWSDETKINRLNSDGRKWVWKKRSGELTEQHVQGTVQFGGGNIMLWGCMTERGVGYACRIDNRMDGDLYIRILGDELQSSLEYYGLEHNNIIFQHDNASVHTTQKVKKMARRKSN